MHRRHSPLLTPPWPTSTGAGTCSSGWRPARVERALRRWDAWETNALLPDDLQRPATPPAPGLLGGLADVLRERLIAGLPDRRWTPDVVWLWWQPPRDREPRAPAPEEFDVLWRGYCRRADLEQIFS